MGANINKCHQDTSDFVKYACSCALLATSAAVALAASIALLVDHRDVCLDNSSATGRTLQVTTKAAIEDRSFEKHEGNENGRKH